MATENQSSQRSNEGSVFKLKKNAILKLIMIIKSFVAFDFIIDINDLPVDQRKIMFKGNVE